MNDIFQEINDNLKTIINLLSNNIIQYQQPQEKPCKYVFYEWLDIWFNTYKKPNLSKSRLSEIFGCIKNHIKPYYENCNLSLVNSIDISKALEKIISTKMRVSTYDVYNESLRTAYENQLIKFNPMISVIKPKHEMEKGKALTTQQQQLFLNYQSAFKYSDYYMFLLGTGCRPFEPLRVKKEHINFEKEILFIDGTKNKSSKRTVPLFDFLNPLVRRIIKNSDTDYLFNFSKGSVNRDIKKAQVLICDDMTLKTLRHTFATRMFEEGIDIKTISKWLGHSSTKITEQIYIDVILEHEQKQAAKIVNFDFMKIV